LQNGCERDVKIPYFPRSRLLLLLPPPPPPPPPPLPFLPCWFLYVPFDMYVLLFSQFTQHCCGSHMIGIGRTELEILTFMNKLQCKLDRSVEYTLKNSAANYE